MNKEFSVYLDLVRFIAACFVYLYHSNQRWLVADILPLAHYGHSAVIIFFVLSGFVIAWVADEKEKDWRSYFASRLSRVFSVVVPALLVCAVLDGVGRQLSDAAYSGYPYDNLMVRLLASLGMMNEIWFVSITSLSNIPFWSVTYEFWYYVLFGLATFFTGRSAWLAVAALALLLGPKIILLAPIWIAGVVLYRWETPKRMSVPWALALVALSTSLIIAGHALDTFNRISSVFKGLVGPDMYEQFTFSKFFLGDYPLAFLVFCNFAGMRIVAPLAGGFFARISGPAKWLAGYTFTLYLLHQPLFLFWGSLLRGDPTTRMSWLIVTALTACSVVLIGLVTEKRRVPLRRAIFGVLQRMGRPVTQIRIDA